MAASYSSPSTAQIRDWTGINADVLDQTAGELNSRLSTLLSKAEAETKAEVGGSVFEAATLEDYHVELLQEAVANRVAALFAEHPEFQLLTGTAEPNLFDTPEALADYQDRKRARAERLTKLVLNSYEGGDAPAEDAPVKTGFTADDDRTFTRSMEW